MKLKSLFSASSDPDSLGNRFRIKRFKFLQDKLDKFQKPVRIIDIGGTIRYWEGRGLQDNENYIITLVNLEAPESPYKNIKSVVGNAVNLSEFTDNSFDLVFSNSVIEHLTIWENQLLMAKEVQRLSKHYFIQTPNKYFPVEPHFFFPFFQFMPYAMQYGLLTKTKLSRMKKWDTERASSYIKEIRLLTSAEMIGLFPGCKVYNEKVAGLVKSITVHNLPD